MSDLDTAPRAPLFPLPQNIATRAPLGALAAGFGLLTLGTAAFAQAAGAPEAAAFGPVDVVLPKVTVRGRADPQGKDTLNPTTTTTGKGKQNIRDIPQSMTTVTERLIDDRNLDTLKDVLRNTAGVTFMAAEGGEEDIRLRGFSLAATGDIFVDGMRDPAFYGRDTFNNDRIDLLRGSASMLFGRGSTGGVANQVSKQPMLIDQNEVGLALGTGNWRRVTGDFNAKTGDDSALRVNVMGTQGNDGGLKTNKKGLAAALRTGIGTADEFLFNVYTLDNHNGINYGLPWAPSGDNRVIFDNTHAYYGMASDYNAGNASWATAKHIHRFGDGGGELATAFRYGGYKRDMRASTVRFRPTNALAGVCQTPFVTGNSGGRQPAVYGDLTADSQGLCRGTNNKVQGMKTAYLQSDYSNTFEGLGAKHQVLAGVDAAHEDFTNYTVAPPKGVTITKPITTVGAADDGAWVDESLRVRSVNRSFVAIGAGAYAQDLVEVAPGWKLLGGLRFDKLKGKYIDGTGLGTVYERVDDLWSKRAGVLFQPTPLHSFHFSWATSFNTSGDTYQYDNQTTNTPPEGSENLELGARIDNAAKTFTTRLALFRSTKKNERNRDPDSAATQNLLSGKRHTAGVEIDLTGKLNPDWEVFGSYAYTPVAKIDVGAPGSVAGVGEGAGTRSSLTPKHAGTIWSTYQVASQWRVGGGINARSSMTPNRNPAGLYAPRWVTADLMAEYAPVDHVKLKLDVANVTDKFYADTLYTGHYVQGAGRAVTLTGTYKF